MVSIFHKDPITEKQLHINDDVIFAALDYGDFYMINHLLNVRHAGPGDNRPAEPIGQASQED